MNYKIRASTSTLITAELPRTPVHSCYLLSNINISRAGCRFWCVRNCKTAKLNLRPWFIGLAIGKRSSLTIQSANVILHVNVILVNLKLVSCLHCKNPLTGIKWRHRTPINFRGHRNHMNMQSTGIIQDANTMRRVIFTSVRKGRKGSLDQSSVWGNTGPHNDPRPQ